MRHKQYKWNSEALAIDVYALILGNHPSIPIGPLLKLEYLTNEEYAHDKEKCSMVVGEYRLIWDRFKRKHRFPIIRKVLWKVHNLDSVIASILKDIFDGRIIMGDSYWVDDSGRVMIDFQTDNWIDTIICFAYKFNINFYESGTFDKELFDKFSKFYGIL